MVSSIYLSENIANIHGDGDNNVINAKFYNPVLEVYGLDMEPIGSNHIIAFASNTLCFPAC